MVDRASTTTTAAPIAVPPSTSARQPALPEEPRVSQGIYARAWRKLRHDPVTVIAAVGLALIVAGTVLAPVIADGLLHTSPDKQLRDATGRIAVLQAPGPQYLLGTDDLGRDVLTRLLFAGRVSLTIGFTVAFVSIVAGTAAGMVAGYFGGWVDDVVNAAVQFVFNIPGLF